MVSKGHVLALAVCSLAFAGPNWQLAQEQRTPLVAPQIASTAYEMRTANPAIGLRVSYSESRENLTLTIAAAGGSVSVPIASNRIEVASDADVIVVANKLRYPGTITCGKDIYDGLVAFDSKGRQIANVAQTGAIGRLRVLSDGRAIVATDDAVRVYDMANGGNVLWNVPLEVDEVIALPGEQFLATQRWDKANDTIRAELRSARTGAVVLVTTDPRASGSQYFAVSSDNRYAFLRRNTQIAPPVCSVDVIDLQAPAQPLLRIPNIAGGPLAADRLGADGSVALAVVIPPANKDPRAIRADLLMFDSQGNATFQSPGTPGPIDSLHSLVRFGADGGRIQFEFDHEHRTYTLAGGEP
ncbi:MAG: hypothetical protein ACREJD_16020 [Phycisphaerales bacterium]